MRRAAGRARRRPAPPRTVGAMTIPAAGYPRAAARSPRVQLAESTDSTNADVIEGVRDAPGLWPHLSVLVTTDQRAGRGRLDRSWVDGSTWWNEPPPRRHLACIIR